MWLGALCTNEGFFSKLVQKWQHSLKHETYIVAGGKYMDQSDWYAEVMLYLLGVCITTLFCMREGVTETVYPVHIRPTALLLIL